MGETVPAIAVDRVEFNLGYDKVYGVVEELLCGFFVGGEEVEDFAFKVEEDGFLFFCVFFKRLGDRYCVFIEVNRFG